MTQLQSTTTEQAGTTCLIAADCGDAGLEVVADDRLRHAADHVQGVDVRSDPSRKTQPRLHATYRTAGASDSEFGRALGNSLLTGNLAGHSWSGAQGSDY